jgi:hypothetical protein
VSVMRDDLIEPSVDIHRPESLYPDRADVFAPSMTLVSGTSAFCPEARWAISAPFVVRLTRR